MSHDDEKLHDPRQRRSALTHDQWVQLVLSAPSLDEMLAAQKKRQEEAEGPTTIRV